ncbi:MAG: energy-coupling factor transporter transmembrane component T [Bacillota bacterium]|nr:energy-coupling factor transporter transmembrane component T [Bacillota bacterium]
MITDITLGQYLPGTSVVHRLDPRTKLVLVLFYVIALFIINNIPAYILSGILIYLLIKASGIPLKFILKSIKPLYIFIIFTAILNIFMTDGTYIIKNSENWWFHPTWEGIYITIIMSLRLIYLVAGTSLLTYTTSPIVLTDGIESLLKPLQKLKFPAHELAMMMTIALRFIPTIIEETDKIMKAQSARGADFDTGGLIKKAKAMIPLLIPLFISAFRRADELALAMECRGYHGGEGRTKFKQLKYTKIDAFAFTLFTVCSVICVFVGMQNFSRIYDTVLGAFR